MTSAPTDLRSGPWLPSLEQALTYAGGTHTMDDVVEAIEAGSMLFWPGTNSAIVTEIGVYPRCKVLHFFLAGGDLAELEAMVPSILAYGRSQGCTKATLAGRPGWGRSFLSRTGWKVTLQHMETAL